jgi:DNA-binding response OmpR family regulator
MDDSPLSLDVTRRALQANGFEVHCARRLADLTRELDTPDLVLMDVDMPEALGDDLAAWLLSAKGVEVPIFLYSNLPEDELAQRSALAGARGYVRKSVGIDAVVAKVTAFLAAAAPTATDVRAEFLPALIAAARRRHTRLAHLLSAGSWDFYAIGAEMHTLVGEAALLGREELVAAVVKAQEAFARGGDGLADSILTPIAGAIERLAADVAGPGGAAAHPELAAHPPSGRRVLLLDDSDFYRTTLLILLEEHGHEVVEAGSLSEARTKMHDGPYDLALLDVHLEDGAGPSLIPELREVQPGIRIVVATGDEPASYPADLVLAKTMPTDQLLGRLEALLAR